MNLNPNSALLQIPEFLINEKADADAAKELLERLNPNSVNVTAALVDKIVSELPPMNNWTDFQRYISEFKLDEIFDGLDGDFYAIKRSELLKGFFTFKGTELDLSYIMRIAGYTLEVYDAEYYRRGLSFYNILIDHFPGMFEELLQKFDPETLDSFFTTYLNYMRDVIIVNNVNPKILDNSANLVVVNEAEALQSNILTGLRSEVHQVDNVKPLVLDNLSNMRVINVGKDFINNTIIIVNNKTPRILDNMAGMLVVNENSDNMSLLSYGISLSTSQIEALLQALQLWKQFIEEFGGKDSNELDCTLQGAILNVDMDSEKFAQTGFRASEVLQDIRQLMEYRLSVCTYIKAIKATLITKDFFERSRRDETGDGVILKETFEVAPPVESPDILSEVGLAFAEDFECHLFPPIVYETIDVGAHISMVIDNVNPYPIPGRKRNYEDYTIVYEKIGAHITRLVDNENPYPIPGREELFQDNYDPEYPPGLLNDGAIVVDNARGLRTLGSDLDFGSVILEEKSLIQDALTVENYNPDVYGVFWRGSTIDKETQDTVQPTAESPTDLVSLTEGVEFCSTLERPFKVDNVNPLVVNNQYPLELRSEGADVQTLDIVIEFINTLWLEDVQESDLLPGDEDESAEHYSAADETNVDTTGDKTYGDDIDINVIGDLSGSINVQAESLVDGRLKIGGNGVLFNDRPVLLTGYVPPTTDVPNYELTGFI